MRRNHLSLNNYEDIKLWADNQLPFADKTQVQDIPTLHAVLPAPEKANGAAVIVFPGGSYINLAPHEGKPVAEWLAGAGYTAFVLSYRRGPDYLHPIPMMDARRAIRWVRAHAAEWQLEPAKIGVLGFSAGGHLASTAANHFTQASPSTSDPVDTFSARPDFQILIYPVITMKPGGHENSRINLLGSNPTPDLIELLSNENRITPQTPPAFLFHSTEDLAVDVGNSDSYAAALETAGIPYKYVRGKFGAHGLGLHPYWTAECLMWLQRMVRDMPPQPPV